MRRDPLNQNRYYLDGRGKRSINKPATQEIILPPKTLEEYLERLNFSAEIGAVTEEELPVDSSENGWYTAD